MGRIQASLWFSFFGLLCLVGLAEIQWLPAVLVVFMLRGAFQNAIYPLDRSVIMDFVPSEQRGKWNAFESITSMTWSGSAVLGGYMMDNHDYRYTFLITALIYFVAFLMRIPLVWFVPKKERFAPSPVLAAVEARHAVDIQEHLMASPVSPGPRLFGH